MCLKIKAESFTEDTFKVSDSDRVNLNVHSGVYFVVVDNKTYKIAVR